LAAACGGGDDEEVPSATTTPSAPASTATPLPTAGSPTSAPPTPASPATPSAPAAPELELPDGFAAFLAVDDLSSPTSLAVDGEGRLYVSEEGGAVWRLRDEDGDGAFEARDRFVEVARRITGIALAPDGALYVSHTGRVTAARDLDGDGEAEDLREIASGLPNGRHQNNGLAFGPDGRLYFTNGSTCNDCQESDPRSAAILRMNADGSGLEVFAGGLRNPYDLTFTPDGRLWSTDNGSDPPCNTVDEVNLIVEGGDYGWPYGPGCDSFADGTAPVAGLGFNTASTGIAYYDASAFPPEYRGNFFVTLWGDLGFTPARAGRVLVRVVLDESGGQPEGQVEDFGRGFERPIDVAVDRDGSLLVADYGSGRVYRIAHVGG
jgi:putative membrane-bound dehydrogenase-like protein